MVTREEIQKRLWPNDTIVEFENSINAAIRRLRLALGDSADDPRFVETLARRGYRFLVTVHGPPSPREAMISERARRTPLLGRLPRWSLVLAGGTVLVAVVFTYLLTRPLPLPKVLAFTQITRDGRLKLGPIFTDGSRLYFGEGPPFAIHQVSTSGGEVAAIPNPIRTGAILDISPNGSELLIREAGAPWQPKPLWVLPVAGGSPRRVGDVAALAAAWLRDGNHIVYGSRGELYVCRTDGSEARKLVTVQDSSSHFPLRLRWSPDGSCLRFSVRDPFSSSHSLWEVSADGTNLRQLLPDWNRPGGECCGSWTPDSRYFVFLARRRGRIDLWALREEIGAFEKSREPVQLTAGPNFFEWAPSSDGKKFFAVGAQQRVELVRYDSNLRLFVPYLGGISADAASFSRDGQWVAYVSFPEAVLWRSRLDGSERLQLTSAPMRPYNPRWSPEGKRIAFQAEVPGKPTKIYVVSADGGNLQQITSGQHNDVDPTWSADAPALIFASHEETAPEHHTINRIDLQTKAVSLLPGSKGLMSPQWSASGRYLLAMTGDWQKLKFLDFTTQEWTELASGPIGWHYWSHDEKYVYFDTRLIGENPSIQRVRLRDRKVEQVVSLNQAGRLGMGNLGTGWTGLAPDDSPLTLRDIGTQEIYALDVDFP